MYTHFLSLTPFLSQKNLKLYRLIQTIISGDGSKRSDKDGRGMCSDLHSKFLDCRKIFFGNQCIFPFKLKGLHKDYLFI